MSKKPVNNSATNPTVAFRLPMWALSYYQDRAAKERRKLSQVLRMVLEDHAKPHLDSGGRGQRAA